jgi:hypothetical protein
MVDFAMSCVFNDPLITWADPTLFGATSALTAARDVPPSATKSAMTEIAMAGETRR